MDFIKYVERLGLGFDDKYKQQSFLNKMYNFIENSDIRFSQAEECAYASIIGIRFRPRRSNGYPYQIIEELGNILSYVDSFTEFRSKLASIVVLVNFFKERNRTDDYHLFLGWVKYALESSHILYQEETYDGEVFIFPKGEPLLDEGEVITPLKLLQDYPSAKRSFISALKRYEDSDESTASNVADSFRKALEAFFQEFFHSSKSLEQFKSDYGNYLKEKGIPSELSKNLIVLFNSYTDYNNNYAKHHEKTSKLILEYLLYETGNIIRLILTLNDNCKREDK